MGYNCVVLVKQVPDTHRITGQVMNDDGTVNRAALPAIFNPEDLNALEVALQIKDRFGGRITVITMGLPVATRILRDALYRGADDAVLVTDSRAAASDTLATSYILSCAVRKLEYDIVLCGRQAIDGDTAQVGPQLAEKLGITQITYVEAMESLEGNMITARRNIGNGWQRVKAKLPVLLTITSDAAEPRVAAARKMMRYKNARTRAEIEQQVKAANPGADDGDDREAGERAGGCPGVQGPADQAVEPGRPQSGPDLVRPERLAHQGAPHPECRPGGQGKQGHRPHRRRRRRHDPRTDPRQDHRING